MHCDDLTGKACHSCKQGYTLTRLDDNSVACQPVADAPAPAAAL
jgi:hypothetical protein